MIIDTGIINYKCPVEVAVTDLFLITNKRCLVVEDVLQQAKQEDALTEEGALIYKDIVLLESIKNDKQQFTSIMLIIMLIASLKSVK